MEDGIRNIYVLDTDVIINDSNVIESFPDADVEIPMKVIEQLDALKSHHKKGREVRLALNKIEQFSLGGDIKKGIPLENGGILRINTTPPCEACMSNSLHDNIIINVAWGIQVSQTDSHVVVVSNDTNMRIKARSFGLDAIKIDSTKSKESLYTGFSVEHVDKTTIDNFYNTGFVKNTFDGVKYPNQYVTLKDVCGSPSSAQGRFVNNIIQPLSKNNRMFGISPKNSEQRFATDCLLDDNVPLVTLSGVAGVGKTILALAAGLQKTLEEHVYSRIIITRVPYSADGINPGAFPGDEKEKTMPWMDCFKDNLEKLLGSQDAFSIYSEKGIIDVQMFALVRGRSLDNAFVIVDEAESMTRDNAKTIITRAGSNTKIVLLGDVTQNDNPRLSENDNGLVYTIDCWKDLPEAAHVNLTDGRVRSHLAWLASRVM